MPATSWRFRRAGVFDDALDFENTETDYVDLGTSLHNVDWSNGITVVSYVEPESYPTTKPTIFVEDYTPSSNNVMSALNYNSSTDEYEFGFFDGAWHRATASAPPAGREQIVVGSYDNSTIKLYPDDPSPATLSHASSLPTPDEIFTLGRRWDNHTDAEAHWDGLIGRVIVYNRALSDAEVSSGMDGGNWPDSGKVAEYTCKGTDPSLLVDSVNGHDGTINGADRISGIDDRLLDVPDCTLAYNRFARSAEVELDDPDGVIPDEYPRPTPVELEVKRDIDDEYSRRFGGFVNNPKSEQNTATLELLSHDAWIRSRDVYKSYSSTPISTILNDLITDLTPLTWDASRVNVYDDVSVDVSWSGTPLDKVVEELASYSNDELFGATDDMVFFFEQRDSNRAPRDFTQGQYFADSVEFEEDGSAELNEVTVYYGGNPASDAVVVDDASAKKSLADELGADRPVVISTSKTFTEITTEQAARRKGREILSGASAIQTGELKTWEAFGVDPGDVTRVQVPEQSIDAEFRVAEISHAWGDDETQIKLAENEQGVVDALVELSDEVSRVEARAADNNATITRFTTFDLPFAVEFDVQAYKRTVPDDQLLFGTSKGAWGSMTDSGYGVYDGSKGQHAEGPTLGVPDQYTLITTFRGEAGRQTADNTYMIGFDGESALRVQGGSSGSEAYVLAKDPDGNYVTAGTGADTLDGVKHTLAARVDTVNGSLSVFLDGQEIETAAANPRSSATKAIIEAAWASGYGHFTGDVFASAIYPRLLTGTEIDDFGAGNYPDNALALYDYTKGHGNSLPDQSANGNDAVLRDGAYRVRDGGRWGDQRGGREKLL